MPQSRKNVTLTVSHPIISVLQATYYNHHTPSQQRPTIHHYSNHDHTLHFPTYYHCPVLQFHIPVKFKKIKIYKILDNFTHNNLINYQVFKNVDIQSRYANFSETFPLHLASAVYTSHLDVYIH